MDNWYRDALCKIHFDMHTPGGIENVGRDFDPAAFARTLADSGAEAVCFFARCAYGWSYYPTQVGFPHPHLARDLFGDGLAALHAAGLRVIAYLAIDGIPVVHAAGHPTWISVGPDAAPRTHGQVGELYAACPSHYVTECLIPQLQEIASRYPVDGFFLDGVYQYFFLPCYCETCQQAFGQAAGGRAIPTAADDPAWYDWRHWQTERVYRLMGQAAQAVTETRPGCQLGVNWLGDIRWSVPAPAAVGYLTGDPPMQNCTFETAFHLAAWAWRDRPADAMTQRMLTNWQDFTCRTPESIMTDYAAGIAGCGRLFIGDLLQPVAVRPDPEVALLHRETFAFAAERAALADPAFRPRPDIAILSSPEAVRGRGNRWQVDESPLRGAFLALMEAGLAADILFDDDLPGHLARYRTLIIPEQRFVRAEAAAAIERFVAAGGGLVITGPLPQAVQPGQPDATADPAPFERLAGVTTAGEFDSALGYLCLRGTPAEGFWREGDPFRPAIPVHGRPPRLALAGADELAPLTLPGPEYQIGARPPGDVTDSPAITEHIHAAGRVLTCALGLAADFWERGNPGAKYVLQALVRRATPGLSFERTGPASVYVTRADGQHATALHLVAYQPDARWHGVKTVESPAEITGVTVRLADAREPVRVSVVPGGTAVEARREGDAWVVILPPFSIHAAVVFEW